MTNEDAYSLLLTESPRTACWNCDSCCGFCEYLAAVDVATGAVERLIPLRPMMEDSDHYYCPKCEAEIYKRQSNGFCSFCGQAIRWENEG